SELTIWSFSEPWLPTGQPSVVDQVGAVPRSPLAGLSVTAPGWVPSAALAMPAPPIIAAPAMATVAPASSALRPATSDLNLIPFMKWGPFPLLLGDGRASLRTPDAGPVPGPRGSAPARNRCPAPARTYRVRAGNGTA